MEDGTLKISESKGNLFKVAIFEIFGAAVLAIVYGVSGLDGFEVISMYTLFLGA